MLGYISSFVNSSFLLTTAMPEPSPRPTPFVPPPPDTWVARLGLPRVMAMVPGARAIWAELKSRPYLYSFIITAHISAVMILFERDWIVAIHAWVGDEWRGFFNDVGRYGKPEQYFAVCLLLIVLHFTAQKFDLWPGWRARLERFSNAGAYVIASIISGGIVLNLAKFVLGRQRPRALFNDGIYEFRMFNTDFGMNAFPSGHSQMAFSLFVALCFVYPRLAWAWLSLASFIAMSRALSTVHFPSDVLMGSYVGICSALLIKAYVFDKRAIDVRVRFRQD